MPKIALQKVRFFKKLVAWSDSRFTWSIHLLFPWSIVQLKWEWHMGCESGRLPGKICKMIFKPSFSSGSFETREWVLENFRKTFFTHSFNNTFIFRFSIFNRMFQLKKYWISYELPLSLILNRWSFSGDFPQFQVY